MKGKREKRINCLFTINNFFAEKGKKAKKYLVVILNLLFLSFKK